MRSLCLMVLLLAPMFCVGGAEAQVISIRKIGNKTVMCMHTGLTSGLRDCGTQANWYSYVFVGSISAMSPAPNDEKRLEIRPEEIFLGNPGKLLTVFTSQVLCLPRLAVGDRWLFYLRTEKDKPIVLDYYANDSLPVVDAKEQIATLRRLETLGDRGILRGEVRRSFTNGKPVGDAVVIAHGWLNHLKYVTKTDAQGRYEFSPLPAGRYTISVRPIGSFRADGGSVEVSPHGCWDLFLTHEPEGRISGYVRNLDGSPVAGADVLMSNVNGSQWSTLHADAKGHFQFESLQPGRYLIGIRLGGHYLDQQSSGTPPAASIYYPGVRTLGEAMPITLRADQKRDNINFTIPAK
jgi:hypothetical protein